MPTKYKLDYNIVRDIDRLEAINDILNKEDVEFRSRDLELMANYLLYGKDENGKNAMQRGEVGKATTKHASYKTKSDKEESLDAIMDAVAIGANAPTMTKIGEKYVYKTPRQKIDEEDAKLPGMAELQDAIKRIDLSIRYAEGKIDKDKLPPDAANITSTEQLYKLKHILIDMRRHQYYIKDAYRPTIHLLGISSPGRTTINWGGPVHCGNNNYVDFNFENYHHISALMKHYSAIRMAAWDDPTGWQAALIMDLDRYYDMANIEPIYDFLVKKRVDGLQYKEIVEEIERKFDRHYGIAYISCLFSEHIPRKISLAARRHRLMLDKDVEREECPKCGKVFPKDGAFFKKNGLCFTCYRRFRAWQEKEPV